MSLRFYKWEMSFNAAAKTCRDRNGHLFDDLDGTKGQLDFLYEKAGYHQWVGVRTIDNKATWIDMDNKAIPASRLLWDPNDHRGEGQFWLANYNAFLNDGYEDEKYYAVCDMLETDTAGFNPDL